MKAGADGKAACGQSLPAASRWFTGGHGSSTQLSPYLEQYSMTQLPYELLYSPQTGGKKPLAGFLQWLAVDSGSPNTADTLSAIRPGLAELLDRVISNTSPPAAASEDSASRLLRFDAPLALFLAAVEYNGTAGTKDPVTQLYIAQAPLNELPRGLQQDVPVPDLVKDAGRGDVYDSSIWLGLEPTYTPWHRDPNPNLFCQLSSSKVVRTMAPAAGARIFRQVQEELMKKSQNWAPVSSRIRGEEMMQGPERRLLHSAVWGEYGHGTENFSQGRMFQARLDAGDMLFIPKGWWHSIRSVHADGRLNGSVNWWFR
ncbi:Transcription elongation factor spt6 [Sporothrix epigloea]|uniref:Transcription elongation factor spt6 n=1 Tax=Sporothrix epigloea TaxID=1892477 RepID=A0ABP0DVL0_9PEZI